MRFCCHIQEPCQLFLQARNGRYGGGSMSGPGSTQLFSHETTARYAIYFYFFAFFFSVPNEKNVAHSKCIILACHHT